MLAHIREVVAATTLPVNADFQAGYADTPDELASNVVRCVATGAAGLSVEDATGNAMRPLYDRALAVERIRAACAAIRGSGTCTVLTARCEAFLVGHPDPLHTVLDRLVAFADAGADCLFAPGVRDAASIHEIVRAVAPKPVNVLMSTEIRDLTVERLADLGVRRVSVGSALARVAWAAFMRAARSIADTGRFELLSGAASFAELNALFDKRETSM